MVRRSFFVITKFGFFDIDEYAYQNNQFFNCLRQLVPCEIYKKQATPLPDYIIQIDLNHFYYKKYELLKEIFNSLFELENFYNSKEKYNIDLIELCNRMRKLDIDSCSAIANLYTISMERLIQ